MSTFQNTLNYTDWHDVDEDGVAARRHGGNYADMWIPGVPGIMRVDLDFSRGSDQDVASSNIRNIELFGSARCRRRYQDYLEWWWRLDAWEH